VYDLNGHDLKKCTTFGTAVSREKYLEFSARYFPRVASLSSTSALCPNLPCPESTKLYGAVEFCDFFFCFSFVRQFEERVIYHPLACQCMPLGLAAERHHLLLPAL
jgi:hypothetical protein